MMRVTYLNEPNRPRQLPPRPRVLPSLHCRVTAVWGNYPPPARARQASLGEILRIVADHYRLTPEELQSRRQEHRLAHPRQMGMYLAWRFSGYASLKRIAEAFGRVDHTTVIHAKRSVHKRIRKNPDVRADYEKLITIITGDADDQTHD